MIERILADTAAAHPLNYAVLRYFNVAGADPQGRAGQSTAGATHLIKVVAEHLMGRAPVVDVFGSDFATPDGSGVRDYIHVSDLADLHVSALGHLLAGGDNLDRQLRLWPRLFGARGDRGGRARQRPQGRGARGAAPRRAIRPS